MNYEIYTDGSHFKNGGSGILGVGGLLVCNDTIVNTMSESVDKHYFRENYGTEDFSNPTMESYAIYKFLLHYGKFFKPEDKIISYSDYKGASEWLNGNWKINKSYIRLIVNDTKSLIKKYNLNIEFKWIKGHAGQKYNEMADKLAKGLSI